MDPATIGITIAVAVGIYLAILSAILIRRWNRENRAKYPDRFSSGKLFEINRKPLP
jgi:hypothetical protein